jgi:hypothetical protein
MVDKKIFFYLAAVILLVNIYFISSETLFEHSTAVKVFTDVNQPLILRFEDTSTATVFKTVPVTTDSAGYARTQLETDRDEVNIIVLYVKNIDDFLKPENILRTEKGGPYSTSSAIDVNVATLVAERLKAEGTTTPTANATNETNETAQEVVPEETTPVEETTKTETTPSQGSALTGAAISGENFFTTKTIYYVAGLFTLIIVIFLTITITKRKYGARKYGRDNDEDDEDHVKVKKLSDWQKERKEHSEDYTKTIEEAERKIREAQEQLRSLKDHDKINEREKKIEDAKQKLIADQKELLRLRRGED